MALLSISIDLSGSTQAKQCLVSKTDGDPAARKDMYDRYARLLYDLERSFYLKILERKNIGFSKFLLVKTIGDEYWYVYDVDHNDRRAFSKTVESFMDAILSLFGDERFVAFGGFDQGLDEPDGDDETKPVVQFDLPVKAFIDLILEPLEVNVERYEHLKDVVAQLNGIRSAVYEVDRTYVDICNRLNLGAVSAFDPRFRVQVRTDYVGLEIDRFFRLTQFCKPLILGVGDTLMRHLPHETRDISAHHEHISVKKLLTGRKAERSETAGEDSKYVIRETIPAASLKGISEDYCIHHVFGGAGLNDAIFAPVPSVDTLLEPTRAFLAEHGFYAVASRR